MDGLTNLTSGPNLQSQVQQAQQVSQQLSERQSGKGKGKKIFFLLVILAIGLLGAFLIFKGVTGEDTTEATPSPTANNFIRTPEPSEETETTEPSEEVDKAEISIQILNGTGISGEAGFLQGKLNAAGFKDITATNASSTDNESAIVAFASSVPKTIVVEITKLLQGIYSEVTTSTSVGTTNDVVITTGLRSGQTLKPSASPKASTAGSSTATPSPSPTN